jgi:predicted nuclease of restriction endonuclease-like (RecB) superfamily
VIALKDGLIEPEHLGLTFQSTARDLTKDPYSFEFLSLTDDYHEKLHCYVVVEVKTGKLTAEGVGHLAFM